MKSIRIKPGAKVELKDFDPAGADSERAGPKDEARMRKDIHSLSSLHERLWAARSHAVLIVLQGIDTAGKDGTIRHVFIGVNPQGCRVVSVRETTPGEEAHGFLWRRHRPAPGPREVVVLIRPDYVA